jgi:hypothetical protein
VEFIEVAVEVMLAEKLSKDIGEDALSVAARVAGVV